MTATEHLLHWSMALTADVVFEVEEKSDELLAQYFRSIAEERQQPRRACAIFFLEGFYIAI